MSETTKIRVDVELEGEAADIFAQVRKEIDYRRPGTITKPLTRAQVLEVIARLAAKSSPTKIRNVFREMGEGK